jgi:glycosyltransferase involved in cell wall biosynthesis
MQKIKEKIKKKEGETILVTTSRLVHKNAIDDVIKALKLLPQNVRFVVAGAGEDVEKLNTLVANLELKDRVTFLGQVDRTETAILRRLGDVFVRPSRSEGLGNSFAEFLFDADRNPKIPPTGYAVDKDSPKQIAEKVLYIMSHQDEVKVVVENAHNLVVADYRWDNIAKKMEEKVFDFVLQRENR